MTDSGDSRMRDQRQRKGRPNAYLNIGEEGRKTGFRPRDDIPRDSQGMVEDVAAFFASPQQKDIQDKDYSPVVPAAAERHQIPVNDRRQSIKGFSPSMDDEDTTRQNSPHLVDRRSPSLIGVPASKSIGRVSATSSAAPSPLRHAITRQDEDEDVPTDIDRSRTSFHAGQERPNMGYDEAILKRQNSPRQLDRKYGVDPRAAPRSQFTAPSSQYEQRMEDDGFEHRRGARYSNGLLDRQSMSGNPRSYARPQDEEDLEGLHSSQPALRTYRDPDVNRGGRNQTRSSPVYKTRREQIYYDDDDADFSASQPAPQRSHYVSRDGRSRLSDYPHPSSTVPRQRPVNGRPLEDWERPRQQPPVYSGAIRRVTEHREMVDRRRADYDIDADYDLDDRPIRREYGDPHDRVQPYLAGDDAFDRDAVPRTSSKTRINVPARQLPPRDDRERSPPARSSRESFSHRAVDERLERYEESPERTVQQPRRSHTDVAPNNNRGSDGGNRRRSYVPRVSNVYEEMEEENPRTELRKSIVGGRVDELDLDMDFEDDTEMDRGGREREEEAEARERLFKASQVASSQRDRSSSVRAKAPPSAIRKPDPVKLIVRDSEDDGQQTDDYGDRDTDIVMSPELSSDRAPFVPTRQVARTPVAALRSQASGRGDLEEKVEASPVMPTDQVHNPPKRNLERTPATGRKASKAVKEEDTPRDKRRPPTFAPKSAAKEPPTARKGKAALVREASPERLEEPEEEVPIPRRSNLERTPAAMKKIVDAESEDPTYKRKTSAPKTAAKESIARGSKASLMAKASPEKVDDADTVPYFEEEEEVDIPRRRSTRGRKSDEVEVVAKLQVADKAELKKKNTKGDSKRASDGSSSEEREKEEVAIRQPTKGKKDNKPIEMPLEKAGSKKGREAGKSKAKLDDEEEEPAINGNKDAVKKNKKIAMDDDDDAEEEVEDVSSARGRKKAPAQYGKDSGSDDSLKAGKSGKKMDKGKGPARSPERELDVDAMIDDDYVMDIPEFVEDDGEEPEPAVKKKAGRPPKSAKGKVKEVAADNEEEDLSSKAGPSNIKRENGSKKKRKSEDVDEKVGDKQMVLASGDGRSKRLRIKPLDYWRNERVKYSHRLSLTHGVVPEVRDIVRIPKTEEDVKPLPHNASSRRGYKAKKKTPLASALFPADFEELDDEEVAHIESLKRQFTVPVFNLDSEEPEMKLVACSKEMVNPTQLISNKDIMFQRTFALGDFFGCGFILLKKGCDKPQKNSMDVALSFFIVTGAVEFTINDSKILMEAGSHFIVPRGNIYGLRNTAEMDTLLYFAQAREIVVAADEIEKDDGEDTSGNENAEKKAGKKSSSGKSKSVKGKEETEAVNLPKEAGKGGAAKAKGKKK